MNRTALARHSTPAISAADLAERLALWGAWAAVLLSIVLMALRVDGAVSLSEPLMTMTSGGEEEVLFGIWKSIHGQPVFADSLRIPFAASYYNWLFYEFFGRAIGLILWLFHLKDEWIPTAGHSVALAISIAGAAIAYAALCRPERTGVDSLAAAASIFLFLGPLTGFFALSLHPEVPATILSIAAVAAFLRLYPRRPICAVAASAALSYLAWAFKQTHLFSAAAIGLLLLIRADWRSFALFSSMHVAALVATVGIGSAEYRSAIFFLNTKTEFASWQLQRNVLNFTSKATPEAAMLLLAFLDLWKSRFKARWDNDRFLIAWLGVIVAGIPSIIASAKTGAAENYFFLFAFFMFFAGFVCSTSPEVAPRPSRLKMLPAAGWGVAVLAIGAVVAGFTGTISVRPTHAKLAEQKACLNGYPRPVFSSIQYLELPWVKGTGPHFLLAYNYKSDRDVGRRFEADGIGGLIAAGRFATVAVPVGTVQVDGAKFDSYAPKEQDCAGLTVYVRRETPTPLEEPERQR